MITIRPLVSVCIATYNHAHYIEQCLQSVVGQIDEASLEIIVGDDMSTDGTRDIISLYVQRYPDIFVTIFHPKNVGGCNNYRQIRQRARGQYIAQLDGDDYWMPGKLSQQLALMAARSDLSAVLSNALVIHDSGLPIGFFTSNRKIAFDINYLLRKGNFLCASTMLFKAEYLHEIQPEEGDFIDYLTLVRLSIRGPLGFIDRPLAVYRWNSPLSTRKQLKSVVTHGYWSALLEALHGGAAPSAFRSATTRFFSTIVTQSLVNGQAGTVAYWWKKMIRESSVSLLPALLLGLLRVSLSIPRAIRRTFVSSSFYRLNSFYPR